MKLLIISDTHDYIERIRHVLEFGKRFGVGAVIHCGDWNTPYAVDTVASFGIPMYGVLGNADIDPRMPSALKKFCNASDEDFLELEIDDKKIGVCHFPEKLKDEIVGQNYDVLFCGHTHKKKNQLIGKTKVINVGALGRTLEPMFAVYDTILNDIQSIEVEI